MKAQIFSIIMFTILVYFPAGCGKEDTTCGPKRVYEEDVVNNFISETLDPLTGNRTIIYENLNTPENICTDDHVVAYFTATPKIPNTQLPAEYSVSGKAYWGLFEREVQLTWNSAVGKYQGTITDIGLKQAFGDAPGWIGLQMKVTFPTQGSLASDEAEVNNRIYSMFIVFEYLEDLLAE